MNNRLNDELGVPFRPLFDIPAWLSLQLDDEVPQSALAFCDTFVRTVALVLRHAPPERALVQCGIAEGAINLTLMMTPEANHVERALLSAVAARFKELHHHRIAAEKLDEGAAALPDFDLEPRNREIDLSPLVARGRRDFEIDIFRFPEVDQQLEQRVNGRDSDSRRRIANTLDRLAKSGTSRRNATPPEDWAARLDCMEAEYPNFSAVLRAVIRPHVSLTAMGIPHRLAPVLLVGEPGVGKTRFANALADVLGVPPPMFVAVASETNASALAGSSSFWSNSAPGQLFEMLAWGSGGHKPVANGLVVLDEVDKPNRGEYNFLGPLYSLLEENTSRTFIDQSLPDLLIDASHVRMIATANDDALIPDPLRSRMVVFKIPNPSPEQVASIAQKILCDVIRKMRLPFSEEMPSAFRDFAFGMSPRSVKLNLEAALATAVADGRDQLIPSDWAGIEQSSRGLRRHPMGFVSA